jgi:hypothetical protein
MVLLMKFKVDFNRKQFDNYVDRQLKTYPGILQTFGKQLGIIIEEETHDYVPRNEDPPKDGKTASGTLQAGFFTNTEYRSNDRIVKEYGYFAYNPIKDEFYAVDQHESYWYSHGARYPGHKPKPYYLKYGLKASWSRIRRLMYSSADKLK